MSTAIEALCVGGPKHGETITLAGEPSMGTVLFSIPRRYDLKSWAGDEPLAVNVPIARYYREHTRDGRALLVYSGMQ